ncbi:MAG TPA: hypothetical protein VNV44_09825 [Solirubrobacteraceae bacterium]|nr:hypothetical protein [Solirubrobacteraceae bacterium]HXB16026.1 hypothetical protein [Solirubrobacteraceae bacterium]
MGYKPRNRREALLVELSDYGPGNLTADEIAPDMTAEAIAETMLRREGLDPLVDRGQYERLVGAANDWLFDPAGRGARSGLPV